MTNDSPNRLSALKKAFPSLAQKLGKKTTSKLELKESISFEKCGDLDYIYPTRIKGEVEPKSMKPFLVNH